MIECTSIKGNKKLIPKEKLILRASAYAIIIYREKILLMGMRNNNKYFPPGGGIELGETTEEALKRELKEETGLKIVVKDFFYFTETFFYYDPLDKAYHNFAFFFTCEPKTFKLLKDDEVNDGEAERPRWINLDKLKKIDLQHPANELFDKFFQLTH